MSQRYMSAAEVAEQLNIAKSTAYAIIQKWNQELEREGYLTLAGKIPKAYFAKKCYGYQSNTPQQALGHEACICGKLRDI